MRYALLLSREVVAIHLTRLEGPDAEEHAEQIATAMARRCRASGAKRGLTPPKLVISPSPYRSFVGRLLKHVAEIEAQHPGRPTGGRRSRRSSRSIGGTTCCSTARARAGLCAALLRHGGPDLAVVIVPWAYEPSHPEQVIEEEEPGSEEPAMAESQSA